MRPIDIRQMVAESRLVNPVSSGDEGHGVIQQKMFAHANRVVLLAGAVVSFDGVALDEPVMQFQCLPKKLWSSKTGFTQGSSVLIVPHGADELNNSMRVNMLAVSGAYPIIFNVTNCIQTFDPKSFDG